MLNGTGAYIAPSNGEGEHVGSPYPNLVGQTAGLFPRIRTVAGIESQKRALITGASRGIGAKVAVSLAARGFDISLCYREKTRRAEGVATAVRARGVRCHLIKGDFTIESDLNRIIEDAQAQAPYTCVILNASGGLEQGKGLSHAMAINCYAPIALVTALLPHLAEGANIVFVTSHGAHFLPSKPVLPLYANVALSKQSGEQCLRHMSPLFGRHKLNLRIVSGDIIEGSTVASLIERVVPGFVHERRAQVGRLPSETEFGEFIADAALSSAAAPIDRDTSFCGSTQSYLLPSAVSEASRRSVECMRPAQQPTRSQG